MAFDLFQRVKNGKSSGDELGELVVQLSAPSQLTGGEDDGAG